MNTFADIMVAFPTWKIAVSDYRDSEEHDNIFVGYADDCPEDVVALINDYFSESVITIENYSNRVRILLLD